MSEELKPCPNPECDADDIILKSFVCHNIACDHCGLNGPNATTKEEAEQLWNNLPRPTGWISVEDRLPEDDNAYLVSNKTGIEVAFFVDGVWCDTRLVVTHWQPLPELPKNND